MSKLKILNKALKWALGGLDSAATKGTKKVLKDAKKSSIEATVDAVTHPGKTAKISLELLDKILKSNTEYRLLKKGIKEGDEKVLSEVIKDVEKILVDDDTINIKALEKLKDIDEASTIRDIHKNMLKDTHKKRAGWYTVAGLGLGIGGYNAISSNSGPDTPLNEEDFERPDLLMEQDTTLKSYEELREYLSYLYGPEVGYALDDAVRQSTNLYIYRNFGEMPDYI